MTQDDSMASQLQLLFVKSGRSWSIDVRGSRVEEADFDEAIVSHADGRRQTMTKVDYYRQPLKARIEQLCKGQVRFFYQSQPVSPLKATRRGC